MTIISLLTSYKCWLINCVTLMFVVRVRSRSRRPLTTLTWSPSALVIIWSIRIMIRARDHYWVALLLTIKLLTIKPWPMLSRSIHRPYEPCTLLKPTHTHTYAPPPPTTPTVDHIYAINVHFLVMEWPTIVVKLSYTIYLIPPNHQKLF